MAGTAVAFEAHPRSRRAMTMAIVMGFIALLFLFVVVASAGVGGAIEAILAAALPFIVMVAVVLLFDRYEPEPRALLALTLAFGATGAVLIALIFNTLGQTVATFALGSGTGNFVATVVLAPIVEEITKGSVVLVLMLRLKDQFNGVVDGIVYAAMVAIGFAFAEDIMYYIGALAQGTSTFTSTVLVRGGFSAFCHPLFTSMTGIGLALSIGRKPPAKYLFPIGGLLLAMMLHGIWNASTFVSGAFALVYVVVFLPMLIVALTIAAVASKREGKLLASYLAPDVQAGLLTPDELTEMTSLSRRRQVLKEAEKQGGESARAARLAFQHAAAQLAFLRNRSRPNPPDSAKEMVWVREIARYKQWADPAWVPPAGVGEV